MRRALLTIGVFFISLITSVSISAQLADTPSPTYRGNLKRTGFFPYTTDIDEPHIKWKFNCGDGVESSPAIAEDGTLYVGSANDNFFALNPDGTEKWRYTREGMQFRSSPTLDEDGTIYTIGTNLTGDLYNPALDSNDTFGYPFLLALNPNGTLKWEFNAGGLCSGILYSPGLAEDGTIYMITGGKDMPGAIGGDGFWAINPDGTEKWFLPTGDAQYSASAIADDETVYFGCTDAHLYALYPNGTLKWSFINYDDDLLDNCFNAVPSIGPDGTIYAGSKDQYLYALNPEDGTMIWRFKMNSTVEATPSIGPDGTIYAGGYAPSDELYLYALDPEDGSIYWRFETGEGVYGTPAIDANGILFFGSYDQYIYSLNPDGTLRWKYKTGGGICMPPTIDKDGTVYIGSWDNYLYAIDGAPSDDGNQTEPYDGDDQQQGEETPGYELIIMILSILVLVFLKKKKHARY